MLAARDLTTIMTNVRNMAKQDPPRKQRLFWKIILKNTNLCYFIPIVHYLYPVLNFAIKVFNLYFLLWICFVAIMMSTKATVLVEYETKWKLKKIQHSELHHLYHLLRFQTCFLCVNYFPVIYSPTMLKLNMQKIK